MGCQMISWLVGKYVYHEVKKKETVFAFICRIVFEKYPRELEEFSTVMQTLDYFSGLHNMFPILSTPLVFRWGYVNTEKVLIV